MHSQNRPLIELYLTLGDWLRKIQLFNSFLLHDLLERIQKYTWRENKYLEEEERIGNQL